MDPRKYFEEHPDRYWISLAGASLFLLLAIRRLSRAEGGSRRFLALVSAGVAAAEVVGLIRLRPAASRDALG